MGGLLRGEVRAVESAPEPRNPKQKLETWMGKEGEKSKVRIMEVVVAEAG